MEGKRWEVSEIKVYGDEIVILTPRGLIIASIWPGNVHSASLDGTILTVARVTMDSPPELVPDLALALTLMRI